jgi:competence protein ComEC
MPLFWISLAFLAGILAGKGAALTLTAWLISAGFSALAAGVFRALRARRPAIQAPPAFGALLAVIFCLGGARYQSTLPKIEPGFIAWYNDLQTPLIIEGVLAAPPDERDGYANLRLSVERLHLKGDLLFRPAHGLLLARVAQTDAPLGGWRYGDQIRLEGQLETPPVNEEFSYRDYLARQGIHAFMRQVRARVLLREQGNALLAGLYAFKGRALDTLYRLFPDPEASLLAGILLGVDQGIPASVQTAFKNTGTSHIIAISGFNIAIVMGLFTTLLGRALGPRRGAWLAALAVGVYTILAGAEASVVRAALMGCLGLLARNLGRRQVGVNTLAFTAALMALFSPNALWDPGFQLSFGATLGLMLYAAPIQSAVEGWLGRWMPPKMVRRIIGPLADYGLLTFAAQVFTLPAIAYHFQRVSLISFVVNPLVLPVQPGVMVFGGLATLAGMVWQPLGQIIAWGVWPLIAYTIRVIQGMSAIPGGNLILGEIALPAVILIYAGLIALAYGAASATKVIAALKPSLVLLALFVPAALVWRAAFAAPDGRLHVTLLETGGGEALLVQTPSGRNLLINGGTSTSMLSDSLGQRLPFGASLDWLVVAAGGDEQLSALPRVLERFNVGQALWAGPTHGTRAARSLQGELARLHIPQTLAAPGASLALGEGATLRALTVGLRGAVYLLEWKSFRLLLPLGIDFEAIDSLEAGKRLGPATAFLLADGGYGPSNPPEWIAALHPQVILLSPSPQQAPDAGLLAALAGHTLLRTDQQGWIRLSTDGERLWLAASRAPRVSP